MFRCADGDLRIFASLTVQTKHKCTRGCGGYLHDEFCGVQEKNESYLKNIALMTYMCHKCAANIGKTELTYKPPIDTEYEYYNYKEEDYINNHPRHSLSLNIRSTSPSHVGKKQRTSYVGEK